MRLHVLELVLFSTYAELRAERARSYLGLAWWVLEPAMQMATYYFVFSVVLKTAAPDYVPFLLIGLTIWQWFKSCVSHGSHSIWQSLYLIRQTKLPVAVFPSVQILADTVKFLFILMLLLVILWCTGYPPNGAYAALVPVLLVELIFSAAAAYFVAALVPLLPDLRFIIEQVLFVALFLSGVVFDLKSVPENWRGLMELNPMTALIDAARGILMHGQWPDWTMLGRVSAISILLYALALVLMQRLTLRYVKLAS
jgi:lipopolysaccharide transport system permease protein